MLYGTCSRLSCPGNDGWGRCQFTACTRSENFNESMPVIIKADIGSYKQRLKQNLKTLIEQPGIITERTLFDVIDKTE